MADLTTLPRYTQKLLELMAKDPPPRGSVISVMVAHDDWCPALKNNGGECTCDFELYFKRER